MVAAMLRPLSQGLISGLDRWDRIEKKIITRREALLPRGREPWCHNVVKKRCDLSTLVGFGRFAAGGNDLLRNLKKYLRSFGIGERILLSIRQPSVDITNQHIEAEI
jgi:hypothetical protein